MEEKSYAKKLALHKCADFNTRQDETVEIRNVDQEVAPPGRLGHHSGLRDATQKDGVSIAVLFILAKYRYRKSPFVTVLKRRAERGPMRQTSHGRSHPSIRSDNVSKSLSLSVDQTM